MGDKVKQWLKGLTEHNFKRSSGDEAASQSLQTRPTQVQQTYERDHSVQHEGVEFHRDDEGVDNYLNRKPNESAEDHIVGDSQPKSDHSAAVVLLSSGLRLVPRQSRGGRSGTMPPGPLAFADVRADATKQLNTRSRADTDGWRPSSAFEEDPRRKEIASVTARLSREVSIWEVVGGSRDGLLVREGASLQSFLVDRPCKSRLMKGSLIREIDRKGTRVFYHLLEGAGPMAGWISTNVAGHDVLACPFQTDAAERAWTLLRRMAMIPLPLQHTSSFSVAACRQLTQSVHGPKGSLAALTEAYVDWPDVKTWLQHASCPEEGFDVAAHLSTFNAGDPVLASLLMDPSLIRLRRTFPCPCMQDPSMFSEVLDPLCGLLPDTVSVAYFLAPSDTLSGAVRFGAQSTQSMGHQIPHSEGVFQPYAHRGVVACVLYDAALWLSRLSWHPNAVLKKITSQFSSPCPAYHTLLVEARLGVESSEVNFFRGSYGDFHAQLWVNVCLKADGLLIASAEVLMASNPSAGIQLPLDLPDAKLAPPGVDWVPGELACARLETACAAPSPIPWDAHCYLKAALDIEKAPAVPPTCAAVEDPWSEGQRRAKDMLRIQRINRLGSAYCNDLCFTSGLAPAAVSHVHYLDRSSPCGDRFEGSIKFGPQASEACFLTADGRLVDGGCMSMVAHFGIPMAAMEDFLAHLTRCSGREQDSSTWELQMSVRSLIPIGIELPFQCSFTEEQANVVGTRVEGSIYCNGQVLLNCTAIVTSIRS